MSLILSDNLRRVVAGRPAPGGGGGGILTWDSVRASGLTLSNDDKDAVANTYAQGWSSSSKNSGKIYAEITANLMSFHARFALAPQLMGISTYPGQFGSNAIGFLASGGGVYSEASDFGSSYTLIFAGYTGTGNQILQIAIDFDSGKLWAGMDGTWVGDPGAGTGQIFQHNDLTSAVLYLYIYSGNASAIEGKLHQPDNLTYSIPTGFTAWSD